jgi:hypothetical protein
MKRLITLHVLLSLMKIAVAQTDSSSSKVPWEFNAALSAYFIPGDFFLLPVVSVDHNHLHLEARYNYEDDQTASLFGGYNFSFGNKFSVDATPIAGVAFGNTNGIIPGYEVELAFWNLGLYSEGEYLFDLNDNNDNFFYNWSELYYVPADWIWFGIAAQRIREQQTELDLQRGVMLAINKKFLTITGYYFNPFTSDDFGMVTAAVSF